MALKDIWNDLVNGESEIKADDINNIADAVIELEENGGGSGLPTGELYLGCNDKPENWHEISVEEYEAKMKEQEEHEVI